MHSRPGDGWFKAAFLYDLHESRIPTEFSAWHPPVTDVKSGHPMWLKFPVIRHGFSVAFQFRVKLRPDSWFVDQAPLRVLPADSPWWHQCRALGGGRRRNRSLAVPAGSRRAARPVFQGSATALQGSATALLVADFSDPLVRECRIRFTEP